MALREDEKDVKATGLEKLSSVELLEMFVNGVINYRASLLAHEEGSVFHSAEEINKRKKEEYMERTKSLREELAKRLEPKGPETY